MKTIKQYVVMGLLLDILKPDITLDNIYCKTGKKNI